MIVRALDDSLAFATIDLWWRKASQNQAARQFCQMIESQKLL
jgi:hypothetical protein